MCVDTFVGKLDEAAEDMGEKLRPLRGLTGSTFRVDRETKMKSDVLFLTELSHLNGLGRTYVQLLIRSNSFGVSNPREDECNHGGNC
jgi:hypothetical protein